MCATGAARLPGEEAFAQMIAAVATRPGDAREVVEARETDAPTPGPGEVVVRMRAATVNPSDLVTISGAYPSRTEFPFVPGFEGVGVVADSGPGVPEGWAGRRVLPVGSAGAWQERKRTKVDWCVPVPDDLPDEVACFAYVNPVTALAMLDRFLSRHTRTVVISAATSAIAGHLAELLSLSGVRPVGVSRGHPGREVAARERWDRVVRCAAPAWRAELADAVGPGGADLVLDCVGGSLATELLGTLAPGGRFVQYGLVSGHPIAPAAAGAARVEPFHLRQLVHQLPRARLHELFGRVFTHQREGRLRTAIGSVDDLRDIRSAVHRAHEGLPGKSLITFP